jgi:hypothetical protein
MARKRRLGRRGVSKLGHKAKSAAASAPIQLTRSGAVSPGPPKKKSRLAIDNPEILDICFVAISA